jgi:Arc/MetJ-type ribon-helix-helix transcriptional regulator
MVKKVSIALPDALLNDLKQRSEKEYQSVSALIRQALVRDRREREARELEARRALGAQPEFPTENFNPTPI